MRMYCLKKLYWIPFIALLITGSVKAQFEEGLKDPPLIAVIKGTQATNAVDSVIVSATQGESSKKIQNIIWFKINELATTSSANGAPLLYYKSGFTATVTLKVDVWTSAAATNPTQTLTPAAPLTVTYNPAGGTQYNPIAYWVLSGLTGYEKVRLTVTSIAVSGLSGGWTTNDALGLLTVENEMRVLRYYNAPTLTAPTVTSVYDSVNHPDQLSVSWAFPKGVNTSQLEYAWVENEAKSYYNVNGTFNTNKLFQTNSTRVDVDTAGEIFNIPLLFDADPSKGGGTLYYRVRSVVRRNNGTIVTGAWGAPLNFIYQGHQPNLNWQSSTSFAENGKTHSVVQYYDGSLRERQTVTKDNSTGNTLVSETMYDMQGRPSLQIMPTPTVSTAIQYFADFNRFANQATNDDPAKYFDLSIPANQALGAPALDTTRGNGAYYSKNNPWLATENNAKFIPGAAGYAYTETRYTDDPTQRVSVEGGLGKAYHIGNGHETKYFYGKPTQNELDALFGTEAGDANHYFKNMVQDPNGQMSVSYVDMHGRTVATALAGASPSKLNTINNNPLFYPASSGVLTNTLVTPASNIIKGNSIEAINTITVPATTIYNFTYQLTPAILQQFNCSHQQICFDCKYDLEITIRQEGINSAVPIVKHYNNLQVVTSNQCTTSMGFIGDGIVTPVTKITFADTLAAGSWIVRKTLTINDSMFRVRRDSALNAFMCRTQQVISDSIFTVLSNSTACGNPPAAQNCTACKALLGNNYSTSNYKANYIAAVGGTTTLTDAVIHALYTQDSLACADACGLSLNPSFNTLAGLRALMLSDMMPYSGQYAVSPDSIKSTDSIEAKYNIFTASYTGGFGNIAGTTKPFFKYPVKESGAAYYYLAPDSTFDNTIYPNGNSSDHSILNTISRDNFTTAFSRSWTGELIYYHPEYSKLHFAETVLASSYAWLDNVLQCNTYAQASAKGYLTPLTSDPYFVQNYVPADKDSMTKFLTKFIGARAPGFQLSIWRIANGEGLCDTSLPLANKQACMLTKDTLGLDASATTNAQKDAVWQVFKTTYLGYRNEMVTKYINNQQAAVLTPSAMAHLQCGGKQLRFATVQYQADQNKWTWWPKATSGSLADTAVLNDSISDFLTKNTINACVAQRPYWQSRLMQCEQLQQYLLNKIPSDTVKVSTIINSILDSMVMVCNSSIDANDPNGASNVNPAKLPVNPANFEDIINHVFSQYGIATLSNNNYFCNPYTIDYPKPYNANPPLFVNSSATIDTCNCKQFALIKKSAKTAGYDTTSLASMNNYLLANYNDTVSSVLWQGLQQCNSASWGTYTCYWHRSSGGDYNAPGPIAYWPLNNSTADLSGNNHTGVFTALSPTQDHQGVNNNAFQFNGYSSKISFADATDLHLYNTDYTISAWVWLDGYNSGLNTSIISRRGAVGPGNGFIWVFTGLGSAPAGNLAFNNGTVTDQWGTGPVATGFWHLLTAVYNYQAQTFTPYLDGVAGTPQYSFGTNPSTGYRLTVGYDSAADQTNSGGYYLNGRMSDLRFYNRALSSTEVQGIKSSAAYITRIVSRGPSPAMPANTPDSVTVYYTLAPGATSSQLIIDTDAYVINITGTSSVQVNLPACGSHSFSISSTFPTKTVAGTPVYLNVCYAKDSCVNTYHPINLTAPVIIPSFLNCGYVKPCITCTTLQAYTTAFRQQYPAFASVPYTSGGTAADTANAKQNALWARYLNYRTGFSKTAADYIAAYQSCTVNPGSSPALCALDKPVTYIAMPDTTHKNPCQQVQQQANFIAQIIVQQQHDSLIANFDSLYIAKCLGAQSTEVFYATYQPSEYHYTLYYYDQAGNLVKTMPPAAVKPNYDSAYLAQVKTARAAATFKANGTNIENMAVQYRYNSINVLTAQKTPDGGIATFWYDRLGRLAISQDANQLAAAAYSYTLYDILGRVTEAGQKPQTTAMTQAISQDTTALKNWLNAGGTKQQITRTVYDFALGTTAVKQLNLRNRVAYTAVLDTDNISPTAYRAATFYSYDIHGNVDTLVQDYGQTSVIGALGNGNRIKTIVYDYDLISGKINQVTYNPGNIDHFYHQYQYDAENRLTGVKTSRDSILWQNDVSYSYYRHGPLSRIQLGDLRVQGIDYAYTLQGWIKYINPSYAKDTPTADLYDSDGTSAVPLFARDAYKLGLHYFDDGTYADYIPVNAPTGFIPGNALPNAQQNDLYNGNISGMAVSIRKITTQAAAGAAYAGPLLYNYKYDQLNRINSMDAWAANGSFAPTGTAPMADYSERVGYDPNGNIMRLVRHGTTGNGGALAMDSLTYRYKYVKTGGTTYGEYIPGQAPTSGVDHLTNQLSSIQDGVSAANYPNDIDNQNAFNYRYDAIGNLVADTQNHITNINWSVYGKILSLTNTINGTITYTYDPAGNRISKKVGSVTTWYVRDASGNVMSVYTIGDNTVNSGAITLSETHLYGSSRLGLIRGTLNCSSLSIITPTFGVLNRGSKVFELSNHLGNVLATISDKKLQHSKDSATIDYYNPDVLTATDYYAFGAQMPGRTYAASATGYRYGFNGKENDNEVKGTGNQQDYGMRIYDPQIGRFLSVDPLTPSYPELTPYQFASNTPIQAIDLDGKEAVNPNNGKVEKAPTEAQFKTLKSGDYSFWKSLFMFEKTYSFKGIIDGNKDIRRQALAKASGGDINMDYYAITITKLPPGVTQEQLFNNFRKNIDIFMNHNEAGVRPKDPSTKKLWESDNPTGAVMVFYPTSAPDQSAVVTSTSGSNYWVFTPIWTTQNWRHPLAGQREFGLTDNKDGTFTFFTRAIDRMWTLQDATYNRVGFQFYKSFGIVNRNVFFDIDAPAVWGSLFNNYVEFINNTGGSASRTATFSKRIPWSDIDKKDKDEKDNN